MNIIGNLVPVALILSGITAGIIAVIDELKTKIILLSVQYVCVAVITSLSIPVKIALIKLAAGLIACLILGLTSRHNDLGRPSERGISLPTGLIFKMLAVLLVSTSAIGIGRAAFIQLPGISTISYASSLLLIGLGLLQLGLKERPLDIGIGLLTLLSGFEIIYTALEPSLALMGLLATINMGIALVISILEIDVQAQKDVEALD